MILGAGGEHIPAADAIPLGVGRRQALVVVATYALVAAGEEAQRGRHRGVIVGECAAQLHAAEQAMPVGQGSESPQPRLAVHHAGIREHAFLGC
ncbi:hypothetical protein D3C77_506400 [compost metagenome]